MISLTHKQQQDKADVLAYIEGVRCGDIVASEWVIKAVNRHLRDLTSAAKRNLKFSETHAIDALAFFPLCKHSKGKWAGDPVELAPWQKFIVWNLFGWRRRDTGLRRYRKAYITVGRKNGKSTFVAVLALFMLAFDNPIEMGAEVYVAATKRDQARIIFNESRQIVNQSRGLRKLIQVHKNVITIEQWASKFEPLGSDSTTQDGLNPSAVLKDELHAWRERHRELNEKMSTGGGSRQQPLEVVITTAGSDDSVLWIEEDDYAAMVLEQSDDGEEIDDTIFVFIARIDGADDPLDESVWEKANPNIDVSCSREYLRNQATEARNKPTALNAFKRYHTNIRVQSSEAPITRKVWNSQFCPDTELLGSLVGVHGGFDLGRSDDFASVARCHVYKQDETTSYYFKARTFAAADRPRSQFASLTSHWVENGHLSEHQGNQIDFSVIEKEIVELTDREDVDGWWYDEQFAKLLGQNLQEVHDCDTAKFKQTAGSYNEPIRTFLRELAAGNIYHDGNRCTAWQMCNLIIHVNAKDEWMPDKSNREKKIDAAVASLMAFARALFAASQPTPQLY